MRDGLSVEMVAVGAGEALAQVVMMGESDPPITASLGPIDRLICRLKSLEGSEQTLPVGLGVNQIGIGKLREHLEKFRKPLKILSEMEETSFRAKWWMKEVRELCYDTEDYLVQSGAGVHRTLGRIVRFIISWMYSKLKRRTSTRVSRFMARAEVLKKTWEQIIGAEIEVAISLKKGRKAVISLEREMEAVMETLTAQLFDMLAFEDDKQRQLKVVIISGFAGSGKTTLARTLYVKCKRRFRCSAFVRVSRNPDFRSLLTSILSQIKAPSPYGLCDVQGLICSISDHLRGKRYFIVIDDVRSPSVWDIISRAFPSGIFRSRILVTTRSEQVEAAYSGYMLKSAIFKMGATDDGCTHTSTKEKSNALNIRYNNLPIHLKTCLLYLGMHPEGCTIRKDDLVKQWVAEVFIPAVKIEETSQIPQNKEEAILEISQYETEEIAEVPQDGISEILEVQPEQIAQVYQDKREEIAGGYFDELVTRGMLQPVDINHKGEILSCTVHHLVLDLIRYKSKEDNFLIVVDNLESTLGHPDIVRRLSVQFGCEKGASIPESIILSQVRSLIFYGFLECVPSFADYGLLRVLNLHIWADEDKIFDLTRIGELCYLRYLKIECNVAVRLPLKIRRLQHLGTLELHAQVVSIPSDIGHLKKLLHVRCPCKADVRDLSELKNLLDLQLTCYTVENLEDNMRCIHSVLENLSSLRCLVLVPASGSYSVNTLPDNPSRMCIVSPAPAHLQKLELSRRCCIFSRLPDWIGELHELCVLKIATRELSREDIAILKGLPALTTLSLHLQIMAAEMTVFGKGGFSLLRHFKFKCIVPWLKFEAEAMPNLEKLKLCFNSLIEDEQGSTPIIIIERLSGLKEISAIIDSAGADAGSAWWEAIRNDRGNPKVQLMGSIYYDEQDRETLTREGSGEDENTEADIRVHTKPESSHLPVPARFREDEPEDQPSISEIISILDESESTDGHSSSQVVMHRKQTGSGEPGHTHVGGGGHSGGGGGQSQGGGGAHGSSSSLDTEGGVNVEAAPFPPSAPGTEGGVNVEIAMGAIGPLLPKLGELLIGELAMEKQVRKGIESLVTELTLMHAALRKVAKVPADQLDEGVKIWAGNIKELSYQMEDIVDAFMVHVEDGGEHANPKNIVKKILKKVKVLFKNGKHLHRISDALEEAVHQAKQLAELPQRYENEMRDNGVGASVDPRMMALYTDVTELVGIEETRDKLIDMLTEGDDWTKHPLKTISIVGFGGLGKTTLAKAAYDKLKVQFDCCAFVSVSQNPEMKTVFKDILYGLDKFKYENIHNAASNEKLLIDDIIEYLNDKRYLIVIDDIWSGKVWELIQCAFSKKSPGSRLITTTRIFSVSEACCSSGDDIYRMEPLSDDVSRTLFCKRLFSHEEGCPKELLQVSKDILKKCGGIPLAIITIASLLANKHQIKRKDQWYALLSSIGHGLTEDRSLEQMRKILLLSYYDLPWYLKPCLLYLSIFPEGHEIEKSRLIWRWISEGFVYSEKQETSLYELGERYFNELVNRSMIQPIGKDKEKVEACRVHDMMHHLICSLSSEENFVTILDGTVRRRPNSENNVRRLSIQNCKIDVDTSRMEHVRSVTICTHNVAGKVLDISCFRVLRVLDLEGCDISDIGYVENLIHLRYLGLKDTHVWDLPVEIGKLQFLITLDIRGTKIKVLPSSVAQLRRLMCLYVDRFMKLPSSIGNLTSLEVLTGLGQFDEDLDVVKGLGHLTKLRVLRIYYSGSDESVDKALEESLGNLCKLESLDIWCCSGATCIVNFMSEGWVPPPQLRRLSMPFKGGQLKTVPSWINPVSLSLLSYLYIHVEEVRPEDIRVLGMMPALCSLLIGQGGREFSGGDVDLGVLSSGAFPCLTECWFSHYGVLPSTFSRGAAPRLKHLCFVFPAKWASREDFDLGMRHLPSLELVVCRVVREEASDAKLQRAKAAVRLAAQDHPNRPVCTLW